MTQELKWHVILKDGMSKFPINKILDTVGDGSGTNNAIGNYSGGAQSFKMTVPVGTSYTVSNLIIYLAGGTAFTNDGYGSIINSLANGWTIKIYKSGVLNDLLDGNLIKANRDLESISTSICHPTFGGLADSLVATISFSSYGMPFYISESEYIEVILNDNFSGLAKHQFIVQGHKEIL